MSVEETGLPFSKEDLQKAKDGCLEFIKKVDQMENPHAKYLNLKDLHIQAITEIEGLISGDKLSLLRLFFLRNQIYIVSSQPIMKKSFPVGGIAHIKHE